MAEGDLANRLLKKRSSLSSKQRSELAEVENELQLLAEGREGRFFPPRISEPSMRGAVRAALDHTPGSASRFAAETGGVGRNAQERQIMQDVGRASGGIPEGMSEEQFTKLGGNSGLSGVLDRSTDRTIRKSLVNQISDSNERMRALLDRRDTILGLR